MTIVKPTFDNISRMIYVGRKVALKKLALETPMRKLETHNVGSKFRMND